MAYDHHWKTTLIRFEYEPFVCPHYGASHALMRARECEERCLIERAGRETRMKTALEAAQTLTGEALERLARHYHIISKRAKATRTSELG